MYVSAHCLAPRDSGPCRAAFPVFYYNADTASCLPFLYGGCQGNGNRFPTVDECMASCSGEGDEADLIFITNDIKYDDANV